MCLWEYVQSLNSKVIREWRFNIMNLSTYVYSKLMDILLSEAVTGNRVLRL